MAEHEVDPQDLLQKFSEATDEVKEEAKKSRKSEREIIRELKNAAREKQVEEVVSASYDSDDVEELKKKLLEAMSQVDAQNRALKELSKSLDRPIPVEHGIGVGLGSIIISEPMEVIEVRVNVDNACIGGKYYSFRAGEKYKVTRDVAQTLREAKKL